MVLLLVEMREEGQMRVAATEQAADSVGLRVTLRLRMKREWERHGWGEIERVNCSVALPAFERAN